MRVLSIDPALRHTGYAVIEQVTTPSSGRRSIGLKQGGYRALTWGVIKNAASLKQSSCLVAIRQQLKDIIAEYQPDVCAVESVIYVQSYRTAITMGAARGAAMIAAAEHGLSIHEYPPKRVKQAVVGRGSATKDQVAFMMRALLGLTETPQSDAADAMAIGLAHFYTKDMGQLIDGDLKEI